MGQPVVYEHFIAAARRSRPRTALVLGSGLGGVADRLDNSCSVPFLHVPGMASSTVQGHRANLILGDWAGVSVLIFAGRVHRYEGVPWRDAMQAVHVAKELGAGTMIFTNAAGGIRADLRPGSLMALSGHLDCTQPNWWRGLPAATNTYYDPALRELLHAAACTVNIELCDGVYAQMTGPCYETKAEIRALRACGADAVGMSTAREVQAAHDLGLRCAAVSCITNWAAGQTQGPVNHDEVLQTTSRVCADLGRILAEVVAAR